MSSGSLKSASHLLLPLMPAAPGLVCKGGGNAGIYNDHTAGMTATENSGTADPVPSPGLDAEAPFDLKSAIMYASQLLLPLVPAAPGAVCSNAGNEGVYKGHTMGVAMAENSKTMSPTGAEQGHTMGTAMAKHSNTVSPAGAEQGISTVSTERSTSVSILMTPTPESNM